MLDRLKSAFDPYILALLSTVALASVLPARGMGAMVLDHAADAAIVLLFFLHGAKLSREAIVAGAGHWRLHLATMGTTFALFPVLGLGLAAIPGLPALVASGMLFLTLLPSTVQSSIAFTSIARGNVAAAVCSASFSNLAGIFITPLLASLLMGGSGASMSLESIEKIVLQLLLPFALGHGLRPVIGKFVSKHKAMIGYVDRGSILLVVYAAFSAGVVAGVWSRLAPLDLGVVLLIDLAILALVIVATTLASRRFGFSTEDEITIVFCGSKKSMASGIPMATILFAGHAVSLIVLPLMLFHQAQLFVCATLARRYAARPELDPAD